MTNCDEKTNFDVTKRKIPQIPVAYFGLVYHKALQSM